MNGDFPLRANTGIISSTIFDIEDYVCIFLFLEDINSYYSVYDDDDDYYYSALFIRHVGVDNATEMLLLNFMLLKHCHSTVST